MPKPITIRKKRYNPNLVKKHKGKARIKPGTNSIRSSNKRFFRGEDLRFAMQNIDKKLAQSGLSSKEIKELNAGKKRLNRRLKALQGN